VSAESVMTGAMQVLGGIALSPLLVGSIQQLKARLQGRPGPSMLQPYRELRRLWGKTGVAPQPRTLVYELAPAVAAGSALIVLLMVPVGGRSPGWPFGHDALVVVGLIALSRFAITLAAWDTAGGFGLMGASRDLSFAVAVEAVFVLVLAVIALPAGSTDLLVLSASAARARVWGEPAHWAAALAFAVVVLAETGRQPIDNPDTHLELTMVHEGPLLEYAGRELAYLQWAAAARHWIMLVLATDLLVPQPASFGARLAVLAGSLAVWCVLLALVETTQAKMRILRVPMLLAAGGAVCLLGFASWFAGAGS
jgi:formate hydrogenlyase subunit 4